jgi:hypothetical protein
VPHSLDSFGSRGINFNDGFFFFGRLDSLLLDPDLDKVRSIIREYSRISKEVDEILWTEVVFVEEVDAAASNADENAFLAAFLCRCRSKWFIPNKAFRLGTGNLIRNRTPPGIIPGGPPGPCEELLIVCCRPTRHW